jgi:putative effector of murein hydrolase LrgA (UPF0299 family)
MKILAKPLDFVYGVVLIGGAPLSVFFLPALIAELFGPLFHFRIADIVGMIIVGFFILAAFTAFVVAAKRHAQSRTDAATSQWGPVALVA